MAGSQVRDRSKVLGSKVISGMSEEETGLFQYIALVGEKGYMGR